MSLPTRRGAPAWRSIIEAPVRRPLRRLALDAPAPAVDLTTHWLETAAIYLASVLTHAVLGFFLVVCYLEVAREPDPVYSVTVWRNAKGQDTIKIGAPEEGPPAKGVDAPPEPVKKEEPPKVEEAPIKPPESERAAPAPIPEPVPPTPLPAPPTVKAEPEGGVPDPAPAAPALGIGSSAGLPKSDKPGAAKPAPGPEEEATEAEIDKDPTATIRRRRSGTLVKLREGSQRDIVVVTGAYDHIQEVLDRLEIPYLIIDPEQLPKYNLSSCKILLVNCHSSYQAGIFRLTDAAALVKEIDSLEEREAALKKRIGESKEKKKVFELGLELLKVTSQLSSSRTQLEAMSGVAGMVENVRKFVENGGYLFTSDWGISILERCFPGYVKNSGNVGPRTVTLRPHAGVKSPLLDEVFAAGSKTSTVVSKRLIWEVDSGSYAIKIEKSAVEILAETADLPKTPAVAVTFVPDKFSGSASILPPGMKAKGADAGTGRVLHILSHFQRQATKQGDYALQNLLLNFMMDRIKR